MVRIACLSSAALALLACAADSGPGPECTGGKCDVPAGECTDARYGDGTCDVDIDCDAPDIDCYVTFDDDAAAAEWFSHIEEAIAGEEMRDPRPLLSQDDPRYDRMRELLDRGWQSYQDTFAVGDLADERVGLVLIDDPTVNAFVAPELDLKHIGLAVMVQSGLLDAGGTKDELLGVVMHELQHAIGLHLLEGRKRALRRYYQVLPGEPEPFGKDQSTDPAAMEAVETLRSIAGQVGLEPYDELRGLPFLGSNLFAAMKMMHNAGISHDAAACENATAGFQLLDEFLRQHFETLDSALHLGGDGADLDYISDEYIKALRDECLAGSTATLIDFLAAQSGSTPQEVRDATSPEDLALVEGKGAVDGLVALTMARYTAIHGVDDALRADSGAGIESLRYFSTEEAADDVTVPVLRGAGLKTDGLADFFLDSLLPPADRAPCRAILDAGEVPPYGHDLLDEHHASCFRAWHVRQLAAATADDGAGARRAPRRARPELTRKLEALRPTSNWPEKRRLSDTIPDCFGTR